MGGISKKKLAFEPVCFLTVIKKPKKKKLKQNSC